MWKELTIIIKKSEINFINQFELMIKCQLSISDFDMAQDNMYNIKTFYTMLFFYSSKMFQLSYLYSEYIFYFIIHVSTMLSHNAKMIRHINRFDST